MASMNGLTGGPTYAEVMEDKIKIGTEVGIKPAGGYETRGVVTKIEGCRGFGYPNYEMQSCSWESSARLTVRTEDQGFAYRAARSCWKLDG